MRAVVRTTDSAEISLAIEGKTAMAIDVSMTCEWDSRTRFLAVRDSGITVVPVQGSEPLFRYELDSKHGEDHPAAHLRVHGHRDELLYAFVRAERGRRAKQRTHAMEPDTSNRSLPRMSSLRFPLGGLRMRPCVEDVLHMLKIEFGIDTTAEWREVLAEGRARWRRRQIGAAVRDAPEVAAKVLRDELHYMVEPPATGASAERTEKLKRI